MNAERLHREYFSQEEAEAKLGKRIRALVEFSGVPVGTAGIVTGADPAGWAKPPFGEANQVYDVVIQWDLPQPEPSASLVIPADGETYIHIRTGKPLVDWFTKDEYGRYLDELSDKDDNPIAASAS